MAAQQQQGPPGSDPDTGGGHSMDRIYEWSYHEMTLLDEGANSNVKTREPQNQVDNLEALKISAVGGSRSGSDQGSAPPRNESRLIRVPVTLWCRMTSSLRFQSSRFQKRHLINFHT